MGKKQADTVFNEPDSSEAASQDEGGGMDAEDSDVVADDGTAEGIEAVFDLEKGTVLLNNGIEMPILGIGTFRLSNEQAKNSVYWALKDGYRLIDTARIYGNDVCRCCDKESG